MPRAYRRTSSMEQPWALLVVLSWFCLVVSLGAAAAAAAASCVAVADICNCCVAGGGEKGGGAQTALVPTKGSSGRHVPMSRGSRAHGERDELLLTGSITFLYFLRFTALWYRRAEDQRAASDEAGGRHPRSLYSPRE